MVIINKILNFLIFLLAIAACVAAVLLHQRRLELRGRADHLANVVTNVAAKLDTTGTDINAAGDVNKELLTWEKYHAHRDPVDGTFGTWDSKVNKLEDSTQKLINLKVQMAETFSDVKDAIRYKTKLSDEAYSASLNSINGFEPTAAPVIDKINLVTSRAETLQDALVSISEALDKAQNNSSFEVFADNDSDNTELKANIETLRNEAAKLLGRSKLLAKGYGTIMTAFEATGDRPP